MDEKERFKVAVLALCADQGMSLGETLTLVKCANRAHREKQAFPGEKLLSTVAGKAIKYPLMALLAAPPALGALGGWGAARLTSGINDRTSDEVKHQEMIEALRQQSEHAKVQTAIAQRRKDRESRRGRSLV